MLNIHSILKYKKQVLHLKMCFVLLKEFVCQGICNNYYLALLFNYWLKACRDSQFATSSLALCTLHQKADFVFCCYYPKAEALAETFGNVTCYKLYLRLYNLSVFQVMDVGRYPFTCTLKPASHSSVCYFVSQTDMLLVLLSTVSDYKITTSLYESDLTRITQPIERLSMVILYLDYLPGESQATTIHFNQSRFSIGQITQIAVTWFFSTRCF